jgi:hypothetical protein
MTCRYLAILFFIARCSPAWAQTTRPAKDSGTLEFRAQQAFNRGEYAIALPLLQKLEVSYRDQTDKLGPIGEQIRVCEKNLKNPPAPSTRALSAKRTPHPEPKAGETLELAIKDLGNFDYDPQKGGSIPADVRRLSGTKVRLHGFMIPMDQAANISQFALVPSLFACCFGQPPQIQHTVVVNCPEGKAVSYFNDEIVVEGKLTVEEKKDDEFIVSLFEVEAASVKPAPRQ